MDFGDTGEGRCPNEAKYGARLAWTEQPEVWLCDEHVVRELRPGGDVIEIHTLRRGDQ